MTAALPYRLETSFNMETIIKQHNYALIDRKRVGEIPKDWPVIPLVPRALAGQPDEMPLLLPLNLLADQQHREIFEEVEQMSAKGLLPWFETLLSSELTPEKLAKHLSSQLLFKDKQNRPYLIRYYDPRVFAQLSWIYSVPEFRMFYGGITFSLIQRWNLLFNGHWEDLPCPPLEGSQKWPNQAEIEARVMRIGLINLTIAKLPPPANLAERVALGQTIDGFIKRGQEQYGLNHKNDLTRFACLALTLHSNFDQHPVIKKILERNGHDDLTYCQRLARLSPKQWAVLRDDLKNHKFITME